MSVGSDNTAYRRGLLLGLTMAEIVILIIFLLLLAFSALLDREKKAYEAQMRLVEKDRTLVDRIIRVIDAQDPAISEELVKAFEAMPKVVELVKKSDLPKDKGETIDQTIVKSVEKAEAEAKLEQQSGENPPQQQLAEALQKQKELETENANLKDQKDNLVSQMKREGRGVDDPPCWSDADKKPEYIFKVDATNAGIIIHDNPIPDREDERSRLPISSIKLDGVRTIGQFRDETRPLFEWSKQKECRFWVLLYDRTGESEKRLYKRLEATVEEHFYKKRVDATPAQTPHTIGKNQQNSGSFLDKLFGSKPNALDQRHRNNND